MTTRSRIVMLYAMALAQGALFGDDVPGADPALRARMQQRRKQERDAEATAQKAREAIDDAIAAPYREARRLRKAALRAKGHGV